MPAPTNGTRPVQIDIFPSAREAGIHAAQEGAQRIGAALAERGRAAVILATGASQFDMLAELVTLPGIDWKRVDLFHLDEYVGISETHRASFVGYLKKRFLEKVGPVGSFTFIKGDQADTEAEIARINGAIAETPIDVAFVGIGENGHLAFNDPPADFDIDVPYLEVTLDDKCRQQQAGEGWFANMEAVPEKAISMSIRQIMKSRAIICTVPDRRKAEAVVKVVEGPVSNRVPASILQQHGQAMLFLDTESASLLDRERLEHRQVML